MLVREDRWFAAAFRKVVPDLPGQNAQLGKASVRGPESVRSSSGIRCHVEISSDDTWQAVQRTYMHLTEESNSIMFKGTVTGLKAGTDYQFRAESTNSIGESTWSATLSASTSGRPN
eukprot:TRINITY_DN19611_c0_g1_i2.p5 TRINITY_DN19611_c0_g1~~TRINITY_DN19611_c0_g1_i2.p5  ORF type:complete len:117 (+),score=17.58 TRINITY_DN19611_c0_g1_i2:315-665(+)